VASECDKARGGSSLFLQSIAAKRLPIVPVDSSAASKDTARPGEGGWPWAFQLSRRCRVPWASGVRDPWLNWKGVRHRQRMALPRDGLISSSRPQGFVIARRQDAWIDPWRPVPRALITHGTPTICTPGSGAYWAFGQRRSVACARLGPGDRAHSHGLRPGSLKAG